jgi:hypothetical protein
MIDRRLIGDLALAILIALPTASFLRPQLAAHNVATVKTASMQTSTFAGSIDRRVSLLG